MLKNLKGRVIVSTVVFVWLTVTLKGLNDGWLEAVIGDVPAWLELWHVVMFGLAGLLMLVHWGQWLYQLWDQRRRAHYKS